MMQKMHQETLLHKIYCLAFVYCSNIGVCKTGVSNSNLDDGPIMIMPGKIAHGPQQRAKTASMPHYYAISNKKLRYRYIKSNLIRSVPKVISLIECEQQ